MPRNWSGACVNASKRRATPGAWMRPTCGSKANGVTSTAPATLAFLLSAKQDAQAAKRFLAKALGRQNHPAPRVIHTDGHGAYPPAVVRLKNEGALAESCRHYGVRGALHVRRPDI